VKKVQATYSQVLPQGMLERLPNFIDCQRVTLILRTMFPDEGKTERTSERPLIMTSNKLPSQIPVKAKSQRIKGLCDLRPCDTLETVIDQPPHEPFFITIWALVASLFLKHPGPLSSLLVQPLPLPKPGLSLGFQQRSCGCSSMVLQPLLVFPGLAAWIRSESPSGRVLT
jgi:hypothetical protein